MGTSFISVSVVGLDPVGEGSDAKFRVSTDESDMSRSTALEVAVSVSEGDTNFISRTPPATPPATVSIPVGSRMATYSVPTTEDTSMNGTNGVITAVVEPGENYKRSATNGSGSVTVLDNGGLPVVSISSKAALPDGTGVTERSTFEIVVSTVENVDADLDVMLNIPDGTQLGFNINGTNPIRIPSGSKTASTTISMATTGLGAVSEQELIYTFEITELTHLYTISPSAGLIRVLVKDGAAGNTSNPVMRLAGPSSIAEGETANYTLTSSHTPTNAPVAVTVSIANVVNFPDFFVSGQGGTRTFMVSDTRPIPFTVATKVDSPDGGDGKFTVSLVEGAGYALPNESGSFKVTTNVTDPIVSIEGLPGSVTQGHPFSFTVKATGAFSSQLPVRIEFADGNSTSITGATPGGVFIPAGEGVVNIPVPTIGTTGSSVLVTVTTINPGGSTGKKAADITLRNPVSGSAYKVEGMSASLRETIILKDGNEKSPQQPQLKFQQYPTNTTTSTYLDSDAKVTFTIESTHIPDTDDRTAMIKVGQTGDNFLVGVESIRSQVLSTTSTTTEFDVSIADADNMSNSQSGTITVQLIDGFDYTIAGDVDTKTSASVNDAGVIHLTTRYANVIESGAIHFTMTATPAPLSSIPVTLVLTDNLSGTLGNISTHNYTIDTSGTYTAQVTARAKEHPTDTSQPDYTDTQLGNLLFNASTTNTGYSFGPRLEVPYRTPTPPPNITISARTATSAPPSISEDSIATFRLARAERTNQDLAVTVRIDDKAGSTTNYFDATDVLVRFPAGDTRVDFEVKTKKIAGAGPDGIIEATILEGPGYSFTDTSKIVTVLVYDTDGNTPVIYIDPGNARPVEGDLAPIQFIRSAGDNSIPVTVYYNIEDPSNLLTGELHNTSSSITIGANEPQSSIPLAVHGHLTGLSSNLDENRFFITIQSQLDNPAVNYRVRDGSGALRSRVRSTTKPVLDITAKNGVTSVTEPDGNTATNITADFTINMRHNAAGTHSINYSVTQEGNFLRDGTMSVTEQDFVFSPVAGGLYTANLSIPILNDLVAEHDGTITVTLDPKSQNSTDYVLVEDPSQTIMVMDEDVGSLPHVTIADIENPVLEYSLDENGNKINGAASFVITSTLPANLTVQYQLTEKDGANFVINKTAQQSAPIRFVREPGATGSITRMLTIPLENDTVGEATGKIEVELVAATGGTATYTVDPGLKSDGAKRIAEATILDDDAPELYLTTPPTVREDFRMGRMYFLVNARVSPNKQFQVRLKVEENSDSDGDFIGAAIQSTDSEEKVVQGYPDFSMGQSSVLLYIPLDDDTESEGDSVVTLTLLDDAADGTITNYTVSADSADNTKMVTITDDDKLPKISITSPYSNVLPDSELNFIVSVNPQQSQPIMIPVTAKDETNDSLVVTPAIIEIGTDGTGTGRVSTLASSTDKVTLTLGYLAEYKNVGELEVPIESPTSDATLTIAGPSAPVAEGGMATFTITADPAADKDITVEVDVSDLTTKGTNFVDNGTRFIRLPAAASGVTSNSVTFDVQTKTDTTVDDDGVLVATLQDGAGYTDVSSTNPAYAEIQDNENTTPVELTVTANASVVYGSESITFTVSRTGDTSAELPFRYDLIDTEDVIDGESTGISGTILVNEPSVQLPPISTKVAATSYTQNAGLTLRLNPVSEFTAATYRVGDPGSTKVRVSSELIPEIKLTIAPNYISEGDDFELVATATPAPISDITINVTLSSDESNNFLAVDSRGAKTISIVADQTSGMISITSQADGTTGNQGLITAQLEMGTSYRRPVDTAEQMDTVVVLEALPVVSISTLTTRVKEDVGNIALTLNTTTFTPEANRPVRVEGLTAMDTGASTDFLGTIDLSSIEIDDSGSTTIQVPVNHNNTYRPYGELTFTLVDGDEYTANTTESLRIVKVIIEDAETYPTRSLSFTVPERVLEGQDIEVMVSNNLVLGSGESIDVAFNVVSDPIRYYNAADSDTSPVTITDPGDTKTITLKTNDHSLEDRNGTIDITLLRGYQYEPTAPIKRQVIIVAKETQPTVTIAPKGPSTIDEGEDAVFTITATGGYIPNGIPVGLTVVQGQTEDFIKDTAAIPSSVMVNSEGTGEITIETIADTTDETDGTITATLSASTDLSYVLANPNVPAEINIKDNDDSTLPDITISRIGSAPVFEGDTLRYMLVADPAPTGDTIISVRIQISETGNFLTTSANPTSRVVTESVGRNGGVLMLETAADIEDEPDAVVVARIISEDITGGGSATYSIGKTPAVIVTVQDNDNPELATINIDEVTSPITEADGVQVEFDITATVGTSGDTTPVAVDVMISQVGDFLKNAIGTRRIMVTPGVSGSETATRHSEAIDNDSSSDIDGEVIAKIVSTSRYSVGEDSLARVVVNDDEGLPNVSITAPQFADEGNSGEQTYNFVVRLSQSTPFEVTVNFGVGAVGDTATINDDYRLVNSANRLIFPANSTAPQYITIAVIGDTLNETEEQYTITLLQPPGTPRFILPGDPTATGTITDNDTTLPTVSIADSSGDEGSNSINGSVQFTVTLSEAIGVPVTLNFTTADGSATVADNDYLAITDGSVVADRTLRIPASTNSNQNLTGTFSITTIADATAEVDETFEVTLSFPNDANATAGTKTTATGTIVSDDAPILSIVNTNTDNAVTEGGDATFDVILFGRPTEDVSVDWATADGTATQPNDYTAVTATTLNFAMASNDKRKPIIVTTIDDDDPEIVQQDFVVNLTNAMPTSVTIENSSATVSIDDNDLPVLTIADASGSEGEPSANGSVNFMPTLDQVSTHPVVITYSVAPSGIFPAEAGDYSVSEQEITIPAGKMTPVDSDNTTPRHLSITTTGDDAPEPNETFTLTYSATNAEFSKTTAIGTINNDDEQVIAINSISVDEADGTAELSVVISPPSSNPVNVEFSASKDSAGDSDYTTTTTSPLQFGANESDPQKIIFNITDDSTDETDETITVTLTNSDSIGFFPTNAIGTVTITDNDPVPTIGFSQTSQTVQEGTTTNVDPNIMVNLSPDSGQTVTVNYVLTAGTASTPADYTLPPADTGILTFDPGQTSKPIPVSIVPDANDEEDETFTVTLSSPDNATLGTSVNNILIEDNDVTEASIVATFRAPEASGDNETRGTDGLVVSLNAPSTKTVKVGYAFTLGSATADMDYTAIDGTLTFALDPNTGLTPMSKLIPFTIIQDAMKDPDETFIITLSERADGNASVNGSNNTSTVTIWDDDTLPNLTIANAEAEEGEAIVFMPTLDIDAVNDVEITYSTSPAGAFPVEAGDYSPESNQTITIHRGETTPTPPATISISTTEDPDSEPNETFKLTYSATNVESPVADDSAIGTIISDDPQVIAINDVTVNEDAITATLNVSISPAPATNPIEVTFTINTDSTTTADSGDYTLSTATPSPLNFGVGESSKQITFNITDDTLAEDSETITVTLTNTENIAYYGGDSTGTVTIMDNDALPALELVALTEISWKEQIPLIIILMIIRLKMLR